MCTLKSNNYMLKFIKKTLEKSVEYFHIFRRHQHHVFFGISTVDFEPVNVCWAMKSSTLTTTHGTATTAQSFWIVVILDILEYHHKNLEKNVRGTGSAAYIKFFGKTVFCSSMKWINTSGRRVLTLVARKIRVEKTYEINKLVTFLLNFCWKAHYC